MLQAINLVIWKGLVVRQHYLHSVPSLYAGPRQSCHHIAQSPDLLCTLLSAQAQEVPAVLSLQPLTRCNVEPRSACTATECDTMNSQKKETFAMGAISAAICTTCKAFASLLAAVEPNSPPTNTKRRSSIVVLLCGMAYMTMHNNGSMKLAMI